MANWNNVWLQQRQNQQAGRIQMIQNQAPYDDIDESFELSPEAEARLKHLQRDTISSKAKRETPWMKRLHYPSFMDLNNFKWDKMELKEDCKTFIWTPVGTVKSGHTKI